MLKCVSSFKSSAGQFAPGDVIEDPRLEARVKAESPESFVEVVSREEPEVVEAVEEPAPKIRLRKKA